MNRKGFAVSGILYTILLIFLAIIYMLLMNFKNKKNLLDQLKSEVLFNSKLCEEKVGQTFTFDYTGDVQEFVTPCEGEYKIELWGASGGGTTSEYHGGNGAYTSGKITLNPKTKLYVNVGGEGPSKPMSTKDGGYNGGGGVYGGASSDSYTLTCSSGGGGSTDIRMIEPSMSLSNTQFTIISDENSMRSRIMVAAGGGGGTSGCDQAGVGANAGGLVGYDGTGYQSNVTHGGTQISGGQGFRLTTTHASVYVTGGFGYGGAAGYNPWGGGGSGWYGGGSGGGGNGGGAGGSSYISGHTGSVAVTSAENSAPKTGCTTGTTNNECSISPYGYFTDTKMIDGSGYEWTTEKGSEVVNMPTHDGESTMTGNTGNGYAKITYLGKKVVKTCEIELGTEYTFDYTGDVQNFKVLCNGYYKVELWGAQGGGTASNSRGGYGAYTSGSVSLNKSDNLYLYVGNQPARTENSFNGGGLANNTHYPSDDGGGATDIRYFGNATPSSSDLAWDSDVGLNSRVMVAAAGGGGTSNSTHLAIGGAGGGLTGYQGKSSKSSGSPYVSGGGTQTTGGTKDTSTNYPGFAGSFGKGGNGEGYNATRYGGGAGGSGYYGGGGGGNGSWVNSGAGGSSYISGHTGSLAIAENSISNPRTLKNGCGASSNSLECSIHYSGLYFINTKMIDGEGYEWTTEKASSSTGMPTHDGTSTMTGNTGNGYAKITYLGNN